jgi:O-glycosyl hydrolase
MKKIVFSVVFFLWTSICLVQNCFAQKDTLTVCIIDIKKTFQTIENFGASDCWSVQFVGNWPDTKKNAMADLLFSKEFDLKGKPKGIGLSLWRFNIGSGSKEQGSASGISTDWRTTECFQNINGTYDWNKQKGQLWFLKAAKQRGVSQFLGFTNSPPVQMTQNGLAFNKDRNDTYNLQPEKYGDYAEFLSKVVLGINENTGVMLNYLSPFNEPEWDWKGDKQEGSPALNADMAKEVRMLDKKLTDYNLNTKIVVTESGQIDYLYKSQTNRPGRDNQIEDFFNSSSQNYIRNLAHVPNFIAGHAYWTVNPVDTMIEKRKKLHAALQKLGLNYWQTEVCLMEKIADVGDGHGQDFSMKTALFFARLIHHDLVISNASAWQWWLGISYADYKDGLIYIYPNEDKSDGSFKDSKLLWSLGNYSRFVRPGAVRVDVSGANTNNPDGLMVSAYHIPVNKQLVVVAINYGNSDEKIKWDIPGLKIKKAIPYTTSDKQGDGLAPGKTQENMFESVISSRSIVTFVCTYK